MTVWQGALFLLCVALATGAQTLTGFAFGLILLGLVGMLQLMPLADAANVVSVLSLANTFVVLTGSRRSLDLPVLRDTLLGSGVGVVAGVLVLDWLSANVVMVLRVLLGMTILACAAILVLRPKPLAERSSRGSFRAFGLVSGVMGGLFSTAGPPLVYQFYRQPMGLVAITQTLGAVFAFNSLLRLAIVVPSGQFGVGSLWLSLLAMPVVLVLTWLLKRHPPGWSPQTMRRLVCALLVLAGLSLVASVVTH